MNRLESLRKDRLQIADQAAKAFVQRNENLEEKLSDTLSRNRSYYKRAIQRTDLETRILATERTINGTDESRDTAPNPIARNSGLPVARLYDLSSQTEPKGFGTCFLIATNIIITNYHVFKTAGQALDCAANFSYEKYPTTGSINEGSSFLLRPDVFFYSYEALDFCLVYVEDSSIDQKDTLSTLGMLPLIATKGKVTFNSRLNIIQYPGGGIKKYTTDQNFIISIDDKLGTLFYTTDTLRGSSGAPCFNSYWEVAGLHYTGVPRTNDKQQWLTKTGQVWNEKMDEEEIDWIANAGKSVSKIVAHLKLITFKQKEQPYIDRILGNSTDPLLQANESILTPTQDQIPSAMPNTTLNFNAPANVYLNSSTIPAEYATPPMPAAPLIAPLEKSERFDENYKNRIGYKPDFIEGFTVPFPKVKPEIENELYKNFGAKVPYIVPYHHYSLVMHKKRRMLLWAASNVNYNPNVRDSRSRTELGSGAWRLDPRIPEIYQIQAKEFYDPATLVDKGHIVRRDDNVWEEQLPGGKKNTLGIEYANADTFHWTNCTPQHEAFNRDMPPYKGIGLWGILENEVKKQLDLSVKAGTNDYRDYGSKASIISGPIFREDDPEYMNIQYPLRFFKIFAIRSSSEGNLVYGFILSQKDKVDDTGLEKPIAEEGLPRFNAKVKAMQVSLIEIQNLTGLIFDQSLHDADVKRGDSTSVELESDMSNFKQS
ncbi:DNA/RNA non-specific endonuclease [Pedobacter sp. MC2016-05]|uniref:DNA/RNA non-specific endonuclease n=1 Tax=Pedobacter sp. MC2016-05 TaxID=2994474 RepID=UPI0022476B89|nr:DNA/RNA non-specific endonuclease [Pedobacter sp. MC2016-05]MCX2476061.1 DNA/RNA non-specific endonuclease [Pedobacter sp. MC2016-05]